MEGQNQIGSVPLTMLIRNLLEPHDLRSVNLASLGLIIALNCAIIYHLSNFFWLALIEMASLARLAIAKSHIAIEFALFSHDIGIHTVSFLLL